MEFVLLFIFLGLTALGVPVAFALCLAAATILHFFMNMYFQFNSFILVTSL